jgi:phage terminase large subunit-like protein
MRLRVNKEMLERLSPSERRRVEQQIAAHTAAHQKNPLWKFRPHVRQVPFLGSRDPIKLFLGGNRSGKTTCGIVDDLIQAVDRKALPPRLQAFKFWEPPFKCRIIVPDFTQTLQGVTLQKIREWAPRDQLLDGGFDDAYDARDHMLWFKNGSFFQFMTFEQALDKFQGADMDRIHYDEEPPERIRRENQMRLIDRNGQEMYTMTPLSGMTFTYEAFYEPWEKLQAPGYDEDPEIEQVSVELPQGRTTVVTVDMDDNPHLNEEAKRRIIDDPTLSSEERQARKKGRFISFAGLVYGTSFRKDRNITGGIIPPQPNGDGGIPEGAHVFVGIDPGIRHMAAVVWLYLTHDNELIQFDELAIKDETIAEVCQKIHLKNAEWRVFPRWYVIDPASRNRSGQTGRSDQMEYADHGIYTILGQNAVPTGIGRVKALFENVWRLDVPVARHVGSPSFDPPKLFISDRCDRTLEQLKRYRWAAPTRSENEPAQAVVKKDDHLLDALRYVVMARPTPPEKPIVTATGGPLEELVRADIEASQQGGGRSIHPQGDGIFA